MLKCKHKALVLESASGSATHELDCYHRLRSLFDANAFDFDDVEIHHEDYTVLVLPIPWPSVHEKRQTPNASCNEITPYSPASVGAVSVVLWQIIVTSWTSPNKLHGAIGTVLIICIEDACKA